MATDAELCECLVEQHNDSDEQPNTDNTLQPIVDSQDTIANVEPPTDIAMDSSDTHATVAAVDSPTDIAMDCSNSDNVETVVDPQTNVEPIAMECSKSNDPLHVDSHS